MNQQQQGLEALQDIKRIMERSGRFISLSGWSGVAAGLCALVGAWLAEQSIAGHRAAFISDITPDMLKQGLDGPLGEPLRNIETSLLFIAAGVFVAAISLAFLFTYIRSRRNNTPLWGPTARRLMWNTIIPLIVGGIVVLDMIQLRIYGLIAPLCLIFYGLALLNGSKYTLGEVRWLGYCQLLLGVINLWVPGYSLLFWAIGFGVLHIVYGIVMWWRYERKGDGNL